MKIIISENQHKFIRRYQEIEDGISDFILTHKLNAMDTFDGFMTELCWDVASEVVSKMNIPEEDYVMYRNQLINFIRYSFYTELKEFWDRNHYWRDNKNINESKEGDNIPSALRRRINLFDHELNTTLRESDPCEYARFNQYKRGIINYTLAPFLTDKNISLDSDEHFYKIRDYLLKIFENKIRLHYDAYSEIHCPDIPEIVTESKLQFIRRYQEIKDWVRSDYNYLLDRGYSQDDARDMVIDDCPWTYLTDDDTNIGMNEENFNQLRRFIENNFEDIIS